MKKISSFAFVLMCFGCIAQQSSRISVYNKTFTTYPYGDPNPVPDPTAPIYPYNHFDGYTNTSVRKEWKVVELENDFIKVMILPEIGGKIWTAIEKKSGKAFIYYNHVVKFRDVAMRGPWTSGGIESNFGTIGHTPNCATPVDYTTIKKADGSVSCFVGALDLLTRTQWRIEINLPADKAYFTTSSLWFNASGIEQPYYHWMNAGIKVSGNLEYVYPGTRFIGHEGELGDWPINTKNNKDITWYNNNNFGGYKSYHVFGKYTKFFGGFWHDENYGVVRFSDHDDKPGKKLWIWGLSRQGMIWENLLTDADGQYTEIQSGRLFNQSAEGSALTPFKHRGFAPYATDTWTEYWYPVMNTKGYVFANQYAALNVLKQDGWLKILLSPVQTIKENLTVMQNGKIVYSKAVSLTPLALFADSIPLADLSGKVQVELGSEKLSWKEADTANNISRPVSIPESFDQNSMYGLYLQGKNNIYFRRYAKAEEKLRACLEKETGFIPALTDISMLLYRKMKYEEALSYAKKALSINTYDAAANYYYGLINKKLGNKTDAIDGFDIATQSEEYRTPAFTELAKIYFSITDTANKQAIHYADKALLYNQENTDALQLLAVAYRLKNNKEAAMNILQRIEQYDPLNCFVGFEKWLWDKTDALKKSLVLKNEMPDQSYLELGLWYYSIGCNNNCTEALQVYPACAEINYWLAWLNKNTPAEKTFYEKAKTTKGLTAFTFRTESAIPLRWYANQSHDWQAVYNLGLIEAACGNISTAIKLLNSCGMQPDDANFYAARAKLNSNDTVAMEADIKKSIQLNAQQWRFYKDLAELYNKQSRYTDALAVVQNYYQKNPTHYIMGMLMAKTFLLNKRYSDAAHILDKLVVIPYEGATDGHRLYKEAHLMLCVEAMKNKNYKMAVSEINIAKQWPETLGVGKPYEEDIDERLENFLLYQCYMKLKDEKNSMRAMEQIKNNKAFDYKINGLISDYAESHTDAFDKKIPAKMITDENSRVLDEWQRNVK
jgi:predicted Zn-dependent protease